MLRLLLWVLAILLLPTQQVYGGPDGSSYLWLRLFGIDRCAVGGACLPSWRPACPRVATAAAPRRLAGSELRNRSPCLACVHERCRCPWSLASLASFFLSIVYLMLALRWMTSEPTPGPELSLWGQMQPLGGGVWGQASFRPSSAMLCAYAKHPTDACPAGAGTVLDLFCALNPKLKRHQLDTFSWPKLWLGFYLNNAGAPGGVVGQRVMRRNRALLQRLFVSRGSDVL